MQKKRADPAKVNATGNPNSNKSKVVINMIEAKISGVIIF